MGFAMEKESCTFQMEAITKESSMRDKLMARVSIFLEMVLFIEDTSKILNLMDKEWWTMRKIEWFTKVSGKKDCLMVLAPKKPSMRYIKETLRKD